MYYNSKYSNDNPYSLIKLEDLKAVKDMCIKFLGEPSRQSYEIDYLTKNSLSCGYSSLEQVEKDSHSLQKEIYSMDIRFYFDNDDINNYQDLNISIRHNKISAYCTSPDPLKAEKVIENIEEYFKKDCPNYFAIGQNTKIFLSILPFLFMAYCLIIFFIEELSFLETPFLNKLYFASLFLFIFGKSIYIKFLEKNIPSQSYIYLGKNKKKYDKFKKLSLYVLGATNTIILGYIGRVAFNWF